MKDISTKIVKRDDKFFCIIDELSIVAEGETLSEAYLKAEKETEDYFSKIKEYGLDQEYISYSSREDETNSTIDFIKRFAISGIFVVLFFIISGVAFGVSAKIGYNSIATYKANKTKELAKDKMSDIDRFKNKLNIIKPYIKEIKKAFNEK